MAMTKGQILAEAMALDPAEKAEIAERLLQSAFEEEPLSPEWIAEISRRIDAVDRGEMPTYPAEEVFERLRAKHGRRP